MNKEQKDFFSRFYEIKALANTIKISILQIGKENEITEEERSAIHYTNTLLIEKIEDLEKYTEEEKKKERKD